MNVGAVTVRNQNETDVNFMFVCKNTKKPYSFVLQNNILGAKLKIKSSSLENHTKKLSSICAFIYDCWIPNFHWPFINNPNPDENNPHNSYHTIFVLRSDHRGQSNW